MFMFLMGLLIRPAALLFVVVMVVALSRNQARMTIYSEYRKVGALTGHNMRRH
jgi:hypothetical protein